MNLTPDYIGDKLLRLGFSPANKGFACIIDATMIIEDDRDAAYNTVKKIYMPLAEKYGTNYPTIELRIRHAIRAAMVLGYERIPHYLHCQPTATNGSYKNADFLAAFQIALHRE